MVECSTRDPEVPSSNPGVDKKKIFHGSNQNNTTTNPSKLGIKTWIYQRWKPEGAVEQWESAGLDIQRSPVQTLVWEIRKSLTGEVRTIPPPISEVKTWSCCGTVVECRTRDPEVPSSNPGVGKRKISHRSNQNNTTTNPSAQEFNAWNFYRWKTEVTVAQR